LARTPLYLLPAELAKIPIYEMPLVISKISFSRIPVLSHIALFFMSDLVQVSIVLASANIVILYIAYSVNKEKNIN